MTNQELNEAVARKLGWVIILVAGIWFWRSCGGAIFCPACAEQGWLLSELI